VSGLVVRSAHLPDGSGPWDLRITGETIEAMTREGAMALGSADAVSTTVIDAAGGTVLPPFVDGHCHLDQSLLGASWTPLPVATDFMTKIRAAEEILLGVGDPPLLARVERLANLLVANGTLAARTHASITPRVGLRGVEAMVAARESLQDRLQLQIVAFPQLGLRGDRTAQMMDQAIKLGCDVVGGMDPASVDGDVEWSLERTFALATRHGLPVDIHVHDPGLLGRFTLERIAAWTTRTGMSGRVVASHALCLGELPTRQVAATLDELAEAGVGVITAANPNAAMPRPSELADRGVRLGLGSDTAHTSAPFGTSDMLRKANLLAQRHTWVADADLLAALDMASVRTAEILGLPTDAIVEGSVANLVIVDARNGSEAVASPGGRRTVIARGHVIADRRIDVSVMA
jgi:cytosine deaminase